MIETRNISKTLNIMGIVLYSTNELILKDSELIKRLARLEAVNEGRGEKGLALTSTKLKCWIDIDPKLYSTSLDEKKSEIQSDIEQLKKRLDNKSYVQNAPKHIVEQTKQELKDAQVQLDATEQDLRRLS